jgi:tetratricopeptide (TPR) repeat protein
MLKKYNEAIPDFLKSIMLKPDEAMYHYNTGIIYLQTGELDEACKYLQKAKEMGYPNAESLITQYCE